MFRRKRSRVRPLAAILFSEERAARLRARRQWASDRDLPLDREGRFARYLSAGGVGVREEEETFRRRERRYPRLAPALAVALFLILLLFR